MNGSQTAGVFTIYQFRKCSFTHNSAHPRAQHHMDGVQDYNLTENLTEFVRA